PLLCLLDWLRRRGIGKGPHCVPLASKRLQHVPVVSHLVVNWCCARRGNGAMAGRCVGCVSARRKAFTRTRAQAANATAATGCGLILCCVSVIAVVAGQPTSATAQSYPWCAQGGPRR